MSKDKELIEAAKAVSARAYAPYSKFYVGAAIRDENGVIHSGCNVENVAYPQGQCAEATAIGAMIAAGGRKIEAICVYGASSDDEIFPCGGCRQRILEFADAQTPVIIAGSLGRVARYSFAELLPFAFAKGALDQP